MSFNNNINITYAQGNLGTPLPGEDYISGILFKAATVPTGFSYSIPKLLFSVTDAVNAGIVGDYSDETRATSKITVSATGSYGDTVTITVVEPDINSTYTTTTIGTYTMGSSTLADTTLNNAATNIANLINSKYSTTGYSAGTPTGGSFSMSAKSGLGTIINSTTPTITNVGGVSVAAAAFSGGVNSIRKEENYQISEFFRQNPNGYLWVNYESTLGSFTGIQTLQTAASNKIRQIGVYNSAATTSGNITADLDAIQAVCNTLFSAYAPLSVVYSPNLYSYGSDLSSLPNIRTRSDRSVSCLIGQDGGALGAHLSKYYAKSITGLGTTLGLLSAANVADDIAWVAKYNVSNGTELETLALGNNALYNTLFNTSFGILSLLDSYGYMFFMKRANLSGSWINDSHCAIAVSSDYAYIERNRAIDKASRLAYASWAPLVNSKLKLNANGTLPKTTISTFTNAIGPNMRAMVSNEEISAYSVTIDPTQNVLSTSTVYIVLNIVPIGIARTISVKLSFSTGV